MAMPPRLRHLVKTRSLSERRSAVLSFCDKPASDFGGADVAWLQDRAQGRPRDCAAFGIEALREQGESTPMRILFVSNPLHGHVNPLLPLARAAQRAWHDVVFATGADLLAAPQQAGVHVWPVGPTHAQAGGNVQESWLDYFRAGARARLPQLLDRCANWRPDWVVHEETEVAGPVLAAHFDARCVVHGLGPAIPQRLLPWFEAALEDLAPDGQGAQALYTWRGATYLQPHPPALDPPDAVIWPHTRRLRPTAPGDAADAAWHARIDQMPHASSIFVTLGTVHGSLAAGTRALAAAVEGLLPCAANLIVAVGPEGDAAALEHFRQLGPHVWAERLFPLAATLTHCDAVVSQGGSGTMLAALAAGLPQLMLPQGADQFRNAELCAPTGAALALLPADATPQAIGTLTRRLLYERSFATAARTVGRQIAAMPHADEVFATLMADGQAERRRA